MVTELTIIAFLESLCFLSFETKGNLCLFLVCCSNFCILYEHDNNMDTNNWCKYCLWEYVFHACFRRWERLDPWRAILDNKSIPEPVSLLLRKELWSKTADDKQIPGRDPSLIRRRTRRGECNDRQCNESNIPFIVKSHPRRRKFKGKMLNFLSAISGVSSTQIEKEEEEESNSFPLQFCSWEIKQVLPLKWSFMPKNARDSREKKTCSIMIICGWNRVQESSLKDDLRFWWRTCDSSS